jgi:hypothetical protein
MVQVAFPVRAVGFRKNRKIEINTSGNCIFHAYGEQTPLNRLVSFLAHHVTSPTLLLCKISYRSVKGLRWDGGPKVACSHRKAESSIRLPRTTVHAVIYSRASYFRHGHGSKSCSPVQPNPSLLQPNPTQVNPAQPNPTHNNPKNC